MKGSDPAKSTGPASTGGMREIRAEGSVGHRQLWLPVERFISIETISGVFLLGCAISALVCANPPWSHSYFALRDTPASFHMGAFSVALDLQHWINEGLMAIFVVALEIRRELVFGDLSDTRKAALPVVAVVGDAAWRHITGAGLIGGVGFTVSLFITGLAFSETLLIEEAKVGVLAASLIAALGGYLFLLLLSRG